VADGDIEALIAGGPSGGSAAVDQKKHYIGPQPDSYVAQRQIPGAGTQGSSAHLNSVINNDTLHVYTPGGGPIAVPQRYAEGTEFGPRMLSPERIAQLQQALIGAGLITKKQTFRVGVWDETSSKAYRNVLAYANQGGIDADTALSELTFNAASGKGGLIHGDGSGADGGSAGRQGRVQTLTPAVTLEEQVQQSARSRLGRKLRKSEVSRFVSVYNGIEKRSNAQELSAANTADAGGDTTLTAPPSTDVAASQFLDSNNAQEEAGVHTLGFLDVIKQMVG